MSRRYDQPFSRKRRLKLLLLVVFRIFPNENCHFRPGLWKNGCEVARLYVLQSYRPCTFCKRKTRGETQFWIELAAPYILSINNEINSDDRLPFIIFLTSIYCKRGYFPWGKFSRKCWQDPSRGGNFHDISHISLIKSCGFYFPAGKFSRRRAYREKRENYPRAKISTFTVLRWLESPLASTLVAIAMFPMTSYTNACRRH